MGKHNVSNLSYSSERSEVDRENAGKNQEKKLLESHKNQTVENEEEENEKEIEHFGDRPSGRNNGNDIDATELENIRDIYPDFNFDHLNAFLNNQSDITLADSQVPKFNVKDKLPQQAIVSNPGENLDEHHIIPFGTEQIQDNTEQDKKPLIKSQVSNPFAESLLPQQTKPIRQETQQPTKIKDESSSLSNKITESIKQRLPKELVSDTDLERINRIFKNENLSSLPGGQNWRWSSSEDEF